MSRLQPIDSLLELQADLRRAAIEDIQDRFLFFRAATTTTHSTLAAGNEQTRQASDLIRIRSVEVDGVTGGTVTVQVKVNGADVFQDALRPVSGGGAMETHGRDRWIFPAGSVITTVIEATSGVPAGSANVVIDTEPFVLVPRAPETKLEGRDRLFISKRRGQRDIDEGVRVSQGIAITSHATGAIGKTSGVTTKTVIPRGGIVPEPPKDVGPPPIILPPPKNGPGGT